MKTLKWLVIMGMVASGLLLGAQRVSMEAPVVRGTPENVTVTARFGAFTAGSEYRLGVAGGSKALDGATVALEKQGTAVGAAKESFDQSQNWWADAGELKAQGFMLEDSHLPAAGEFLVLRVTVPRTVADAAGSFYVFVAKRYGPNTWYLEDGAEITEAYW